MVHASEASLVYRFIEVESSAAGHDVIRFKCRQSHGAAVKKAVQNGVCIASHRTIKLGLFGKDLFALEGLR